MFSDPSFLLFKDLSESLPFLGPSSTAILVTKEGLSFLYALNLVFKAFHRVCDQAPF